MKTPIEPDSSSSSSDAYETYSLEESLTDYPFFNGRRYHCYKEGSYLYPNDEQEQWRLNLQYSIIKRAQAGNLFFAPVTNPKEILDVGTGTGVWAIDMADEVFPDATITGVDLSPIQPSDVPPNVHFYVDDCSEPDWKRPLGSLDFIYSRCMLGSFTDPKQYMINARKYLRPGSGWIECCEPFSVAVADDDSVPSDWTLKLWEQWLSYGSQAFGRPIRIADKLKQWMIEAGYVDVHEVTSIVPIGRWPKNKELKQVGKDWRNLILHTLAPASYKIFSQAPNMKWSQAEIEVFLADTRNSLNDHGIHAYHRVYNVYGRRPSPAEEKRRGRMAPPPPPKG